MFTPIEQGNVAIEDALLDLKAMIRLGLHMTESSNKQEFGEAKDTWCTLMYLLLEKVGAASKANGLIEDAARKQRHIMEGLVGRTLLGILLLKNTLFAS